MWIEVYEFSKSLNCDDTSRFDAFISYIGCNTRLQVVRQNLPCISFARSFLLCMKYGRSLLGIVNTIVCEEHQAESLHGDILQTPQHAVGGSLDRSPCIYRRRGGGIQCCSRNISHERSQDVGRRSQDIFESRQGHAVASNRTSFDILSPR